MYEVLALSMELAGRPRAQIERVVLSLNDFGSADYRSMIYSAAYLTRFDRRAAALRLYREASNLAPERPEPYILGLKHARHLRDADAVRWAACGILAHAWTRDYAELHHEAENAALEAEQWERRAGNAAAADEIRSAIAQAQRRDVTILLKWSGNGDLDLIVEEPGGTVCSFQDRETTAGGVLTHDGYGPEQDNCYEEYVCAFGRPGEYRIRVRHAWGKIVGRRATLTIVRNGADGAPQTETRSIMIGDGDAIVDLSLQNGRRTAPRSVSTMSLPTRRDDRLLAGNRNRIRDPNVRGAALREFNESRRQIANRPGAVGFQPIVQIVPEGAQMAGSAVVSADRRYVRISVAPMFSTLVDVFPFSIIGPTGGNQQPAP